VELQKRPAIVGGWEADLDLATEPATAEHGRVEDVTAVSGAQDKYAGMALQAVDLDE